MPSEKPISRFEFGLSEHESLRLDHFLVHSVQSRFTRSQIKRAMEMGYVTLNGEICRKSTSLKEGDVVTFDEEGFSLKSRSEKFEDVTPVDLPIDIVYQDLDLAIVDKPQGISMHPSSSDPDPTLVHGLLKIFGGKLESLSTGTAKEGEPPRPGIVHRIDKWTSGIVVIAKNDDAHLGLSKLFESHDIERKYLALVFGCLKFPKTLKSKITRNPIDRKKMISSKDKGRDAITDVAPLKWFSEGAKPPFATLVEAKLHTGRTHQVRVHLTEIGLSIMGDATYGVPRENQGKLQALPQSIREKVGTLRGQLLHAKVLGFTHPLTGKPLRFESDPKGDFQMLLEALKPYERTEL